MTKFIVNNRTDAWWKTDVSLFFTITNCQVVRYRSLMHRIKYKFMCLSAYWLWKLANERARISAVIVKKVTGRFRHVGEEGSIAYVQQSRKDCNPKKIDTKKETCTIKSLAWETRQPNDWHDQFPLQQSGFKQRQGFLRCTFRAIHFTKPL